MYRQVDVVTVRALQRPFAVAQRHVLVGIIRALDHVAAAGHVVLAILRTVDLVRIIAAVVLFVALEEAIDALAVRAVERAWWEANEERESGVIGTVFFGDARSWSAISEKYINSPAGQALARHMKGRRDSQVVSSQD